MPYSIKFSPLSRKDLKEIQRYITKDLCSPIAAQNTIEKIFNSVARLESFPVSETPLSALCPIVTKCRFVAAGSYLAFYRHVGNIVYIDRVLYSKSDYLRTLLE